MGNPLRLLILCLLTPILLSAQHPIHPEPPFCSTPSLTDAQRKEVNEQAKFAFAQKLASNAAFSSITYVPIRPHILRRSDGTGGMLLSSLNNVMAVTNSYYLSNGYGIQFYFCGTSPDYVDNDAQYNSFNNETLVTQGHDVSNALNQYYVYAFASGSGGYAYYPANGVQATRSFILNESWNEDDMGNRLIPHELGHAFNLVHTFGEVPGNGTLGSGTTTELVTRGAGANCTTDGDYICDTPADPYNKPGASLTSVNGCPQYNPASTARDANGEAFSPSVTNIMSYYFPCTHNFTPGQYDRMQAGLALRQTHTAYTLDCPPTLVLAPGNVAASVNNNTIVLTWQDNATNEMGYFIERSLSSSSGFLPIGGVGPNATTFTDSKTAPFTTYYYRLKPSNATTAGLSQTVSIRTPACRPTYSSQCAYEDGLSGVAVNGVVLSQNSGCSPSAYNSFTSISTTVVAGITYPISGTLLSQSYQEGITVWVDLDRDGLFDASRGERLFQTPSTVTDTFSGSITLPASLTIGPLSIRITVAYNTIPNSSCGSYAYGETEDYVLNVVNPSPTAGSGVNKALNLGSTNPVTIPATTFTNITPSSDVALGSVTSIRITRFPTNTTSLTINATAYTASSVEFSGTATAGVTLPTDGSGSPTVAILIDPTVDSAPVSISFVAVDNFGSESLNTGTATLLPAADLTAITYARPTAIYSTANITVVVDVIELNNVASTGLITVRLTKDARASLNWSSGATTIGGHSVQNNAWTYDGTSNANYYILTTSQVMDAGGKLSFGLTGVLTPGATSGGLTLSSVIIGTSGGELRTTNNVDADKIDYFQQ